jgi:hypothetical protein
MCAIRYKYIQRVCHEEFHLRILIQPIADREFVILQSEYQNNNAHISDIVATQ